MLSSFSRSLVGRLTSTYAILAAFFLAFSFLLLFLSIDKVLESRLNEDFEDDIEEFSVIYAADGIDEVIAEIKREAFGGEHEAEFLILIGTDGQVIHQTDMQTWGEFRLETELIGRMLDDEIEPTIVVADYELKESTTHIIYGNVSPEYILVLGESSEDNAEILELLAITCFVVFFLALPLIALLVWFITRRALTGIRAVSVVADDISAGNLDRRVNAANQVDEVQTLADTFDAMAERIQQLIRNTREMNDNIAHDMRSPLGRIRLLSESTLTKAACEEDYRKSSRATIVECDRLIAMINTTLDVSETEAGVSSAIKQDFDFTLMVEDVFDFFAAAAEQKCIRMSQSMNLQTDSSSQVHGDEAALQRLVANLFDNAIKYTPDSGEITLILSEESGKVILRLRNTGIGIAKDNHERVFNRFFRVDPSRGGSGCGLGLSYARAVARAHHGDITMESEVNQYVELRVELPLVKPKRTEVVESHTLAVG